MYGVHDFHSLQHRGMMAKRDGDMVGSMSRNLMDKNFNFAEQVLEVKH